MGRLTRKHESGEFYIPRRYKDENGNNIVPSNQTAIQKLAHYEDLEEQGRLIVLKPRTDMAKDALISSLVHSDAICPEDMGFEQEDNDCKLGCHECWKKHLAEAKLKELEE